MPRVQLAHIASARSGDKGEGSNVGVMAHSDAAYRFLKEELTAERVCAHMSGINAGTVTRYEADNMLVLNFLQRVALHGEERFGFSQRKLLAPRSPRATVLRIPRVLRRVAMPPTFRILVLSPPINHDSRIATTEES